MVMPVNQVVNKILYLTMTFLVWFGSCYLKVQLWHLISDSNYFLDG